MTTNELLCIYCRQGQVLNEGFCLFMALMYVRVIENFSDGRVGVDLKLPTEVSIVQPFEFKIGGGLMGIQAQAP